MYVGLLCYLVHGSDLLCFEVTSVCVFIHVDPLPSRMKSEVEKTKQELIGTKHALKDITNAQKNC